ncbi:MAG: HAMP domain-containing sensor histidine kinase [Pseudomonadota bacterium]
MIGRIKDWAKRHWPPLRLRTILFATLIFVAALPGIGAIFLRVYENTLVRQTEAELVAQSAALSATAAALWPGAPAGGGPIGDFRAESPQIDLNASPILPPRPNPQAAPPPDADAVAASAAMTRIMGRTQRTTLAAILLLDRNGRIAGGSDRRGSLAMLPEVRQALAGHPATVIRRNAGYRPVYAFEWLSRAADIRVHHARPILVDGKVVGVLLLSRTARALFRGIYQDGAKIAFGVVAIFATLVVLTGLLSRGIARPIEELGRATRQVAAGGGAVPPVPPTAAIEIQALYRDFAAMADAIDRRSRYLRDFAHAVSHEFKTPLAGIRGAIELLQDHDATMAPGDRRRFLANADADAERLSLLVTRLLELARADMAAGAPESATPLEPVVHGVADALRTPDFAVMWQSEAALPPVRVPLATLERALTALVENSRQAGARAVTIAARREGDAVIVTLADDGPGIAEGDCARVFEPFFTTRRAEGGSGLGLAIVRSLLEAAGARIALVPTGEGACFRLQLPVAA